ncbi:MAG: hypothetical protein IJ204_07900 [Paludibacteraceae bacterium]|nr:hypothetical protein [Paludibacteraceae bacterium]
MKRCRYIVFLLLAGMVGQGCSSRAIHEAEAVVAQADSLWQAGLMYGIDAGDSLTLAQAYETLGDIPLPFRTLLGVGSSDSYAHACYHYGKLLRAKDHPAEAMQAFINATHSRTHDYHILGRVYSNMGDLCHLAGDFQLSYDMFEKSANCFLEDKDTLSYYFLLNDMAFELAEQGKKDEAYMILDNIRVIHSDLFVGTMLTRAVACKMVQQYDSTIYYTSVVREQGTYASEILLNRAQAYSLMGQKDSAVFYANMLLATHYDVYDQCNALYILTNDDSSQSINSIRKNAADRADSQKIIENKKSKLSQAVQLLQQDLARKPDWQWLYTMIATVLIIGAAIVVYVYRKHKKHDLLAQKISSLTLKSNAVQANHEKLVNRYESQHQRREEETLHRCALLRNCPQIAVELKWNDFDSVSNIIDSHFYLLATKLRQKAVLNETEIRLCILVLIGLNRSQIANTMPYALNSIGKLKDQTAKKLGTSGKNLRDFLIKIVVDE